MIAWLSAFVGVTRGEIVGAIGSILGGIIGALGAALAVYLTLSRARKDEREKISGAVRREVFEFTRAAAGLVEICEKIRNRELVIPVTHFPFSMRMPKPTIYPAIADRIGRLHAPHRVVAFFTRIAEIEVMAEIIGTQTFRVPPMVTAEDVSPIIEASVDVLTFGRLILTETKPEPDIDTKAQAVLLRSVEEALARVSKLTVSN